MRTTLSLKPLPRKPARVDSKKASTASADYDWFEHAKNEAPPQGARGARGF